jgi:tape measure domain-containing protein
LTIRDIAISFGYEQDKASEGKINKSITALKNAASDALGGIGVRFVTDSASEKRVADSVNTIKDNAEKLAENTVGFSVDGVSEGKAGNSIDGLKDEAKTLEKNKVGYEVDKASENKAVDSIKRIRAVATKALGLIGIGFSLVKIGALASEFGSVNDQIRDATRGLGDQNEIQKLILRSANESRQSYADMASTISVLARNTDAFGSVEDAARFAELMAKEFRASGKSAEQTSALMKQVTNSLSSGSVNAATMATLLRESPGTVNMLADSLGVSTERLQEMAAKGEVSAETIRRAFEKSAGSIDARFGDLDMGVSDALRNIRNQWGQMDSPNG